MSKVNNSMMRNKDLKDYAKEKSVNWWQVAEEIGVCQNTMVNRLRKELSEEEKANYIAIIDKLSQG